MGQAYRESDVVFRNDAGSLPMRLAVDTPAPGMPLQLRSFTQLRRTRGPTRRAYEDLVTPALAPRKPSFIF
ncbi:hypothetical protein M9978_20150 [Sphingomonas sp. MG17]|uniref:Uncharacterized protein n=1 Tax=Sphingomonas tagetis TaxID=2949092 RepID=A0A9X2HNV6_9SPHN|nr:hypothetical protein [Sphingomonas tagetis]MCP3732734.1 hypothetical protein [Sphingomonas tagetis]